MTITKSSDINNSNLLVIIIIITLFVQQFHSITNEQVGLQQQSTMLLSSYRKDAREKQSIQVGDTVYSERGNKKGKILKF